MKSLATSSAVIDANIVVFAVWPSSYTDAAQALLARLRQEQKIIHVPELWRAEVTSVLHQLGVRQGKSQEKIRWVVQAALKIAPKQISLDDDLCLNALDWAARLSQVKAYDAFYLALAERLNAEFWTGDKRLYNRSRQTGADFVRLLGDG